MLLRKILTNKYRFKFLLFFILLYLILPAFITNESVYSIVVVVCLSFIFLQSLFVLTEKNWHLILGYVAVGTILGISWFSQVFDHSNVTIDMFKLGLYALFFSFVMITLFRWLIKSANVTIDSIIVAIAIYCLFGIIGGSLASAIYILYPEQAYNMPDTIQHFDLLDFTYFSFVTLTTLGYGDITPIRQESQTLSYMLAVIGQFYMAIIIAILVSQYIVSKKTGSIEDKME